MKRNQRTRTVILALLILATLAFIWGNSLDSAPESSGKSQRVKSFIEPVLEPIVGVGQVTEHLIRKLAHFTEFFLLGLELALWLWNRRGYVRLQGIANSLFFGMAAALADETIQSFIDRGDQVSDVLLDFGGFLSGHVLSLLILALAAGILQPKRT